MTINYYEGCFGPELEIDGKLVNENGELDKELMKETLLHLINSDLLDEYDYFDIFHKLANNHDILEDEGHYCEQCGSWDYMTKAEF
jgi:hypothetical protein